MLAALLAAASMTASLAGCAPGDFGSDGYGYGPDYAYGGGSYARPYASRPRPGWGGYRDGGYRDGGYRDRGYRDGGWDRRDRRDDGGQRQAAERARAEQRAQRDAAAAQVQRGLPPPGPPAAAPRPGPGGGQAYDPRIHQHPSHLSGPDVPSP